MSAVERHAAGLHDGCVDTGRRHAGSRRGGTLPRTARHKKYCRDRTARRCSPTPCSPGSYTAGSSPPALAPHAPTALDSAGLRGAKWRAEDRPHRHRTAGGPGVLIGSRAFSLLGRDLKLKRNRFVRLAEQNPGTKNGCWSFCRRWRQTALRSRRGRRQQTKNKPKLTTGPPAVKPRISPESRGFESPSTALDEPTRRLNHV